jgi:putative ABC transport system permease protein
MKWLDGVRARLRLLLAPRAAESRMHQEFEFHLAMEADRLVRDEGITPAEARRRARAAFGGIEAHKESLRDGRGLAWLGGLALDFRLGGRNLRKYPGVTIVGGLAILIGVTTGAAYLEVLNDVVRPSLPLEEGHRIVGLRNWDVVENDPEPRALHEFLKWRDELTTIRELNAFRSIERNLGAGEGVAPALGAQITPDAFATLRVPALLGRTLFPDDGRDSAAAVVVLGYHLWRNGYAGDATLIGRAIPIGGVPSVVVGIMPEGFGFPFNHQFWIPWRDSDLHAEPRRGPAIQMFGRLTPGASFAQAQAELTAIGLRTATELPATHEHLRPRLMKYIELYVGEDGRMPAYLVQVLFIILALILSSNVATMIFARTATREQEIAMRFALGASRGRVLGQFFVEALVLALAAAAIGLVIVARGSAWLTVFVWTVTDGNSPFWLDRGNSLNPTTVLYGLGVAILAALIAGVTPALKATRSTLQSRLRHAPGMPGGGLRFGGLWSAMIVMQVAFAVVVMPPAIVAISGLAGPDHADPGFPSQEYLSTRLVMDAGSYEDFRAAAEELRRRASLQTAVTSVTMASRIPGMSHPEVGVEVEDDAGTAEAARDLVMPAAIDANYFDTFGAPILTGRAFSAADLQSNAAVVVVNEHFVEEILGGRNAVGRRIRYQTRVGEGAAVGLAQPISRSRILEPSPWYQIVGVVRNLGMDTTRDAFASGRGPGVYHPLSRTAVAAGSVHSVRMAFHVHRDVATFSQQLRSIAQAVHPGLRLYEVTGLDGPVDRASATQRLVSRFFSWLTALVALTALLISVAGIYALLSFTVARQTREIGIRIALGADARRIIAGVFSRAMIQIGIGIVIGAVAWFYVIVRVLGGGDRLELLVATAMLLTILGTVACGLPVRRALRIEPTEALKEG